MKKWREREREREWDKETGLSYDTECRKDYAVGGKKRKVDYVGTARTGGPQCLLYLT